MVKFDHPVNVDNASGNLPNSNFKAGNDNQSVNLDDYISGNRKSSTLTQYRVRDEIDTSKTWREVEIRVAMMRFNSMAAEFITRRIMPPIVLLRLFFPVFFFKETDLKLDAIPPKGNQSSYKRRNHRQWLFNSQ